MLEPIPFAGMVEIDQMNVNEIKVLEDALKVIEQLQAEIAYWKEKFNKAMEIQTAKPAKYSAEWWKEVEEFNKKAQEK